MDGYKIAGLISLGFAALTTYWLFSPSKALSADPLNSLALIIFACVFLTTGVFLLFFGYVFSDSAEGD
jgi:hypothetical protein